MKLLAAYCTAVILIPAIKTLIFWVTQKLAHYKTSRTSQIDEQASRISKRFNYLSRSKVLTRKDILIIRNLCNRYVRKDKKYENDAHLIYSVLKYSNIQMKDIANIELVLNSAEIKHKKQQKKTKKIA